MVEASFYQQSLLHFIGDILLRISQLFCALTTSICSDLN